MLKVVTEADFVKEVAACWKKQYFCDGKWYDDRAKDVYQQLCTKKPKIDAEVAAIIGNHSWSSALCSQCREYTTEALVYTDDERHVALCFTCLTKALSKAGYKLTKEE